MTTAAVTIDVDGTGCYHEIHGLAAPTSDPIFERALPRFLDLCARLSVTATLFVVGRDVDDDVDEEALVARRRRVLRDAVGAGHEVASHSYAHDYGMSRWSLAQIEADLGRADRALTQATGVRPQGFRAPGYNQSDALLSAVEALGYAYDSSYMPTPAYFALRAAAITMYRARGRPSQSLVGDVREFLAPRAPFVPSRAARHRPAKGASDRRGLVEIPMTVASPLRLPWLGTNLALLPDVVGRALTRSVLGVAGDAPVVLELHAIDFAGAEDGFAPALVAAQADLRVPLATKLRRLEATLTAVRDARSVRTMAAIAAATAV